MPVLHCCFDVQALAAHVDLLPWLSVGEMRKRKESSAPCLNFNIRIIQVTNENKYFLFTHKCHSTLKLCMCEYFVKIYLDTKFHPFRIEDD